MFKKLYYHVAQSNIFAARCYASAACAITWCVCVRLCVCHVCTFCQNE